jgi:hypothetical protein|tara:strand:- start:1359 stop:2519 length:1161 start_codon:yes stop_codon:yes gene_type:complete
MVNFDEEYDVYVASEVRDFSIGGVSFWVDSWIRYVVPYLRVKPILIIEVEPTDKWMNYASQFVSVIDRPGSKHKYECSYPSIGVENYFSLPDTKYTNEIIKKSRRVHILSCPYGSLYKKKVKSVLNKYGIIDTAIIHSLETQSVSTSSKYFNISKRKTKNQERSLELQENINNTANETIWIGINKESDITHHIPNFYNFTENYEKESCMSNVVGYAARSEARKNFYYLQKLESKAFTADDIITYWETSFKSKIKFDNVEVIPYSRDGVHDFFSRTDWGIFHGAYENEPFGYSIFQALDYNKIPIISKDWCVDYEYPFRSSTQKEFEEQVAKISKLSQKERDTYIRGFKVHLSKYTNTNEWRDKLLSIYNKSENETWLPGSLQPSNS